MRISLVGLSLAGCLLAQPAPKKGTFSDLQVRSVPEPTLPSVIADLGPVDITAHEKGVPAFRTVCALPDGNSSSSQRQAAAAGGGTKGVPLFVDDEPPGGSDGSFELSLGERVRNVNGVWATHSHREPHLFWIINRKGTTYSRRAMVIPPDSVVEIHLEKFKTGDRDFSGLGTIRMEQTTVPGYGNLGLPDHPQECNRDYVWKVTLSGGVGLEQGGLRGFRVPMSGMNKLKIARINVWRGPDTTKPPAEVYQLHSGCASFQICGRFNRCQPMRPPPGCAFNKWKSED